MTDGGNSGLDAFEAFENVGEVCPSISRLSPQEATRTLAQFRKIRIRQLPVFTDNSIRGYLLNDFISSQMRPSFLD